MNAGKTYSRFVALPRLDEPQRMDSIRFTQTLVEGPASYSVCHCAKEVKESAKEAGLTPRIVFPEYGPREDGKGTKIVGYHCLLCRCDEHTPQAHGKPTTEMPGCGRYCTRGATDVLLGEGFPSFEEWVRTQGGAALQAAGRATVYTKFARSTGR